MAYVFKGTNLADPEYMSEPLPESKCGTRKGFRQHQNDEEEPCDPCAAAHAEYMREYMRKWRARHGTVSAYRAHVRAGEVPCAECAAANVVHVPAGTVKRVRPGKLWTDVKCGSVAGYRLHYRHDVPVCDACREANKVYLAGYREQRAA